MKKALLAIILFTVTLAVSAQQKNINNLAHVPQQHVNNTMPSAHSQQHQNRQNKQPGFIAITVAPVYLTIVHDSVNTIFVSGRKGAAKTQTIDPNTVGVQSQDSITVVWALGYKGASGQRIVLISNSNTLTVPVGTPFPTVADKIRQFYASNLTVIKGK